MVGESIDRSLSAVDLVEGPVGLLVDEAGVDDLTGVLDVDKCRDEADRCRFCAELEPGRDLWAEPCLLYTSPSPRDS